MKQVNNFPFSDNIVDGKQTDAKPNQSTGNDHGPNRLQGKEADRLSVMDNDSKAALEQGLDNSIVEEEYNELPVTLLDRVIAFLVLILPFSQIITWGQEQLDGVLPQSIANMGVLVGIIVFLLAVGRLSKIVCSYRIKYYPR
jgi:hypothetical protein